MDTICRELPKFISDCPGLMDMLLDTIYLWSVLQVPQVQTSFYTATITSIADYVFMVDLKAIENLLLDIIYCRERNTPREHDVQVFLFHMLPET